MQLESMVTFTECLYVYGHTRTTVGFNKVDNREKQLLCF